MCAICGLKKGPMALIFVQVISKNCPSILRLLYRNFIRGKQVKFFILCGNLLLRESQFHIVSCSKSFDFQLFFV